MQLHFRANLNKECFELVSHQIRFCFADNGRVKNKQKYQKEGQEEFSSEQVRGNIKKERKAGT